MVSHLWSIVQWGTIQVVVDLHPPLDPQSFASRKQLCHASFKAVQQGLIDAFSKPLAQQMS